MAVRLRETIDAAHDAYIEIDGQGVVAEWNRGAQAIFGWAREEAIGAALAELIIPAGQHDAHRAALARFDLTGQGMVLGRWFDTLARRRDGSDVPVELVIWHTETADGRRFHMFAHDITQRRRRQEQPQGSDEGFRTLFTRNPQPMWVFDQETLAFLEVNDAAVRLYGYSGEEFAAMRLTDLGAGGDRVELSSGSAGPWPPLGCGHRWRHQAKSGQIVDVELTAHPLEFAGRAAVLMVAQDVTDRLRAERVLTHQALHDALTGLPNRAMLLDRLGRAIARAQRADGTVAVIFLDLDRFKVINDGLGHTTADRLLAEVADRLSTALRAAEDSVARPAAAEFSGDTVARVGGDEFVVLIERIAGQAEAAAVAERIGWALERPFHLDGSELYVTASQGIALAEPGDTPERLLSRADTAMYRAKRLGGARVQVADEAMRVAAAGQLQIETALRRALDAGEFMLHYQPVVAIGSGRVAGAEALLRWNHPDRGLLGPDQFLPAAEDSRLIVPIGEWVLRQALHDAGGWPVAPGGRALEVAVNLSARQLQVPNLPFQVARALSTFGISPQRLHLEITESVLMRDPERASRMLKALRELGVRIDVDDFGTGYSSLSHVAQLPVDTLKIDKSFVDRLDGPNPDAAIVKAVVSLGRSLGLSVIAEGVETGRQQDVLRGLDCGFAQGHHYARPMPTQEFAEFLGRPRLPRQQRAEPAAQPEPTRIQ